jgi:hypothetical protein
MRKATAIAAWTRYHREAGRDPLRVTDYWAEMWVATALAGAPLNSRIKATTSVQGWVRSEGGSVPWASNPRPQPLPRRVARLTFDSAWAWVGSLKAPERGWAAMALLTRASASDLATAPTIGPNGVWVNGLRDRYVPLTRSGLAALADYRPMGRGDALPLPPGATLRDLHAALAVALQERGVDETTAASIYGRWSAAKFVTVSGRVGWFGVGGGVQNPTEGNGPGLKPLGV